VRYVVWFFAAVLLMLARVIDRAAEKACRLVWRDLPGPVPTQAGADADPAITVSESARTNAN
jgi:hypothetical protein